MNAIPVENALVPLFVTLDENKVNWLIFAYTDEDKDPWKWPKVLKYDNMFFRWMSYNSDSYHINYKQIPENQIATIIKKR